MAFLGHRKKRVLSPVAIIFKISGFASAISTILPDLAIQIFFSAFSTHGTIRNWVQQWYQADFTRDKQTMVTECYSTKTAAQ